MDLSKTNKSLCDFERRNPVVRKAKEVVEIISILLQYLGQESLSRQNLLRLGTVLMTEEVPKIFVPTCPDYSHVDGSYDFKTLGGGIPLLTNLHLSFLKQFPQFFSIVFLLANQEAYDDRLCKSVSESTESFLEKLSSSKRAILHFVEGEHPCHFMTDFFPSLSQLEKDSVQHLRNCFEEELRFDTALRMSMYQKIGVQSFEEGFMRTVRTASQYVAFAMCVKEMNGIVLNHSTVNLKHYKRQSVALIHNPVCVY